MKNIPEIKTHVGKLEQNLTNVGVSQFVTESRVTSEWCEVLSKYDVCVCVCVCEVR